MRRYLCCFIVLRLQLRDVREAALSCSVTRVSTVITAALGTSMGKTAVSKVAVYLLVEVAYVPPAVEI